MSTVISHENAHSPDIRVFTSPCLERLQLTLWLTHPCAEKVEFSKRLCSRFGVAVNGIETFVVLNEAHNIVLPSSFDELVVVRKKLSCGFGNKDVNTTFDCV